MKSEIKPSNMLTFWYNTILYDDQIYFNTHNSIADIQDNILCNLAHFHDAADFIGLKKTFFQEKVFFSLFFNI